MPKRMSAGSVRRTYQFIEAHRHQYAVQVMCEVLEITASGYYKWRENPISNRAREDERLLRLIRASFVAVMASMEQRACVWICGRLARPVASIESSGSCGRTDCVRYTAIERAAYQLASLRGGSWVGRLARRFIASSYSMPSSWPYVEGDRAVR